MFQQRIKFLPFFLRELTFNTFVVFIFISVLILYISAVVEKVTGIDNTVDFLKIFTVILNIVLLGLLLFRKSLLTHGSIANRAVFICGLISLTIVILLNLGIAVLIRQSPNFETPLEDDQPISAVPYNSDFLTTGTSLGTDLLYLYLYAIFKVNAAAVTTIVLILINIIIIAVAFHLDTDLAIDIANHTLALVTCSLSVFIWTAKVMLTEEGDPKEIVEYGLLLYDTDERNAIRV